MSDTFLHAASSFGLQGHDVEVRGIENILKLQPVLNEFCHLCDQDGRMDDLLYFFHKPGLLPSRPHLYLLLKEAATDLGQLKSSDLIAAVLLYEYQFASIGLKAFTVVDRTGGALIAPPEIRILIAARMRDIFIKRGAHVAFLTVDATGHESPEAELSEGSQGKNSHLWKIRHRHYPSHLELKDTFDDTLATINKKTRTNLRYYRKRAEAELGAHFLPEISVSEDELIAFNKECSYAVSDDVVRWRFKSHKLLQGPFMMGIKDKDNRWLSILAGRRVEDRTELLWQLNRNDMGQQHSIGTVMRSYYIEEEIKRGSRRLSSDHGTPHPMTNSFVHRDLYDIAVVRSPLRKLFTRAGTKYLHNDNPLAELLADETQPWHKAGSAPKTSRRNEPATPPAHA